MENTHEAAKKIVEMIRPDLGKQAIILALSGPLGAGKTAMTKVIALELGITEDVTSPTYVLHVPYKLKMDNGQWTIDLNHLDVWRLETWDEVERLGLQKMIDDKSLIIIEWADKFEKEIKELGNIKLIWVKIEYDGEERKIEIK
ncbi:MAG: tRNA (adenosine(37)-N6)-threonylcarbamoyltransferase complex ATPase subunit type 1 TsaE [Patescibacteria group bacterium]